ncbi:MBOAT, membrane-bound O-acyltransferase family-domain-containing protein [Peziza echinospora]|nr:MBOAT, membrane-bound O-acyltransferase family-domain-containing protein [Peziza echinospora]
MADHSRTENTGASSSIQFHRGSTSSSSRTPNSRPQLSKDAILGAHSERTSSSYFTGQKIRQRDVPDSPTSSSSESALTGDIVADGRGIPVVLERIPGKQGGKEYMLKLNGDVKKVLEELGKEYGGRKADGTRRSRRKKFSDLVFTRQFTTFDRLNTESSKSPFHGFYTLFWLSVTVMIVQTSANSYRSTGSIFGHDITDIMFKPINFIDCMFMDFVMCFITQAWCVLLQKAIVKNYITWGGAGWILQSIWQISHLAGVISYTLYRDWPWIQTVFIVLHCIVILMKQHSYAFYNGHLSQVYRRKSIIENILVQLKNAAYEGPLVAAHGRLEHYHGADKSPQDFTTLSDPAINAGLSALLCTDGEELSQEQVEEIRTILEMELEGCDHELGVQGSVQYPENVTFFNYLEYLFFPTVVYELEYPRQDSINWTYVAEKLVATFGVLGIMIVVSQHYIYPVVVKCNEMRSLPIEDRLKEFPWILNDLMVPFIIEYMMVWYLIWECILNLLGELMRFADRGFYGAWWNSTTWDQFSRDWNKPVYSFLLRHVYHSSISAYQVSKPTATLITFFLSSCIHELVMWCIFKKLRGYLLCMQMLQIPLVFMSRTKLFKDRETLGNVMFWVGIYTGPSFLCSLYLII